MLVNGKMRPVETIPGMSVEWQILILQVRLNDLIQDYKRERKYHGSFLLCE
jgi:hypothetical protein